MKLLRLCGVLILAVALLAGSVSNVFAQEAEPSPRGAFGTTSTVSIGDDGEGSFQLETKRGPMEVTVTADTKFHLPTLVPPWQTSAELGEPALEDGNRVAILLTEPAADHVALQVMILPQRPVNDHTAGVIIEVGDNTLTLENKDGNTFTFTLPEGFPESKVGDLVTVISKRLRGILNPVAKASVGVEKIQERLNKQIEKIALRVSGGEVDEATGGKDIERLKELLKANYERHHAVLERISVKFEARFAADHPARLAIERHKENAQQRYEKHLAVIEKGNDGSKPESAGPSKGKPEGAGSPKGKGKPE